MGYINITKGEKKMKKIGLVCLILTLLALPMSALALEKMSGEDLGDVTGQAGVTIAFGGASTTTISFDQINWGDPDGMAGTCGSLDGWIIIDGTITIDQIIADGEKLELDVGTTGGAPCNIAGAVTIPADTTFIAVGLPSMTVSIDTPDTLTVGFGTAAETISGTLGLLNLQNLSVDAGTPDKLYIWAH